MWDLLGDMGLGALNLVLLALLWALLGRRLKQMEDEHVGMHEEYKYRTRDEVVKEREECDEEHKKMYEDFLYRKRRNSSGAHAITDKAAIAGMVAEILKEKK